MENAHLIVGLGNPGAEYAGTRHNVGFRVVELLAERSRANWSYETKFQARLARAPGLGPRLLMAQPQTYMNASGEAVAALVAYYQIPLPGLLIVLDDADLPIGEIRLRPGGGPGGHHGLESIEQHLGTQAYPRLRLGIGRQPGARQIAGHVLGRFSSTEAQLMDKVLSVAADQAQAWLESGIQKAMSRFNGPIDGPTNERQEQ